MSGLDFLTSLISAVPAIISDFKGSTSDPYKQQKSQAADNMSQITGALTDNNNPLYKQLYGQYQDQNRQNMAQTIAELQGQNRMATGMGRTPLFDPSRGGEMLFRGLMQGQQSGGVQSDLQTRQALQGALNGNNVTNTAYINNGVGAANAAKGQVVGYQGISDLLKNFMGGGSSTTTSTPPMSPPMSPQMQQPGYYPNSQFLQNGFVQPQGLGYSSGSSYNPGWGGGSWSL